MASAVDQDSDDDGWVHIDPDNPADSSGDDAGVRALSSPDCLSDEDQSLGVLIALCSSTRLARSPSPDDDDYDNDEYDDGDDDEGLYGAAVEEEDEEANQQPAPPPAESRPLSGLFHHTLEGEVAYTAFDPVVGSADRKVLVPDPAFSACNEEVTVLASTGGLVCLFARASGVYIVANPATYKHVRLPRHSCDHRAYGDPAVVITFEEDADRCCCADHRGHYHVVVAFPIDDGVYAYESFSSRTWDWAAGVGITAVERVVATSGVGARGKAYWRTALGYFLSYDPDLGVAKLIPAPREVLHWPIWELGEVKGALAVTCMDDRVNEVARINFDYSGRREELEEEYDRDAAAARHDDDRWSLAAHFEGGCMRNREGVYLLRSQGHEVVMWYPLLEIVVAMDVEGRTTRTIGPLCGRQYYSDFIPYATSSTGITRIEAGADCTSAAANADEA